MSRKRRKIDTSSSLEGDMTPMIDMTFQLIAFFMVLISFTDVDPDARIKLPASELAKPPEGPLEVPIYIQLQGDGTASFSGEDVAIQGLKPYLLRERQVIEAQGKQPGSATIIIRADRNAKTGQVQELIAVCQEAKFDRFALRAEQTELNNP